MFRNYLKVAFRNFVRTKLFLFLNIFGLAIGMACSILIFLWVQDELSYDQFNTNANTIYRLTATNADEDLAITGVPLAQAIKKQIPEIKATIRLERFDLCRFFTVNDKIFEEKRVFNADSNFLNVFTYPLIEGDAHTALVRPDGIVITEAIAKKYFGNQDPMNKIIRVEKNAKTHVLLVRGVLKNLPHNSHLQFDILLPMAFFEKNLDWNPAWSTFDVYTYVQFDQNFKPLKTNIKKVEQQVDAIYKRNTDSHIPTYFHLQPLTAIHLYSNFELDIDGQGAIEYVKIFSLIAIFILVIASINFMNLSAALSTTRAKEIGLRKTVGAHRLSLIIQFLLESIILSFVSLIFSIVISYLLLPFFNNLAAKAISTDSLNVKILITFLATSILVGMISGSYPALVLSAIQPANIINGDISQGKKRTLFRDGLVIIQFSISVVLIICTIVVFNQLVFINNRNIGYNKENLLYVQMPQSGNLDNNVKMLKTALEKYPSFVDYTIISMLPTNLFSATTDVVWKGKDPEDMTYFTHIGVDENFIRTFNIPLVAGRFFSNNFRSDEKNFVLNETALTAMSMKAKSAIGQQISLNGDTGQIIGVVKDFNFTPVYQPVGPLILRSNKISGFLVIRSKQINTQKTISQTKEIFQKIYSNYPFTYGFVEEDLSNLYMSEQRMGKLFTVFSVLSIIISCLGLFGLAAFTTQRRIKEISVRKVLGASVARIVYMLLFNFLKLVALASLIAFPIAWWYMNKWLQNFADHINIAWWVFAIAGTIAFVIAIVSVSFQTIRAAMTNPVKNLKI